MAIPLKGVGRTRMLVRPARRDGERSVSPIGESSGSGSMWVRVRGVEQMDLPYRGGVNRPIRALLTNIHEKWTTGMGCTGLRELAEGRWDQADDNHDSDFDSMIPI